MKERLTELINGEVEFVKGGKGFTKVPFRDAEHLSQMINLKLGDDGGKVEFLVDKDGDLDLERGMLGRICQVRIS